jgi:hypothetical protein
VPRFLALDADAGGLFVVAGSAHRGSLTVEQAVGLADAPAPLTPATAAAAGAKLKDLLRQTGVKPAPVLLVIGRDRVILKDVRHPPTAPADEPQLVRFQAVRDLPESPDDVVMDYVPLPGLTPAGERRATAVFVRKEVLTAARALCEAAGLKLAGVTPRSFALAVAVRGSITGGDDPTHPLAVVAVWDGGGEVVVVRGREVTFARPIPAAATAAEGSLAQDIRRNLTVYGGQNPTAPVAAVYVADPDGTLADRLAEYLPLPVRPFDPLAGVPSGELVPASLRSRFAAPVGLLAAMAAADLPINFVTVRQPREERKGVSPKLLVGGLALVLLLAMGAVVGYLEVDKAETRLAAARLSKKNLDDELARLEPDGKRLAAADAFAAREVVVLDQLYDLAALAPDVGKMSVTAIDIETIPPPKADTKAKAVVTAAAGATTPVAKKADKPEPVAKLRVELRTQDDRLPQRLVDGLNADRTGYANGLVVNSIGGSSEAKGQANTLTALILRRPPTGYTRTLPAPRPATAPAPTPAPTGDDAP